MNLHPIEDTESYENNEINDSVGLNNDIKHVYAYLKLILLFRELHHPLYSQNFHRVKMKQKKMIHKLYKKKMMKKRSTHKM